MGQGRGQFPVKVNSLVDTGNVRQRMENDERFVLKMLSFALSEEEKEPRGQSIPGVQSVRK